MKKFTIVIETKKVSMGHQPHRSGAGNHADKRNKRCRTRSAQNKKAIQDKSDG